MATVSSISTAVTELLVSRSPGDLVLVTGEWNGAAAAYLQVFDADRVATGDVPKISRKIYADDRFELDLSPGMGFGQCIVGVSSTEKSFTAVTEPAADPGATMTAVHNGRVDTAGTIGASQAGVDRYEIANGTAVKLRSILVLNGDAAVRYAQLHEEASANVADGDYAEMQYRMTETGTAGATLVIDFGANGRTFTYLTIVMSTTSGVLTASTDTQHTVRLVTL